MYSQDNIMDELNEFLECACGRCECCDCEGEHQQGATSHEEINYDEFIDNLNEWD